MTKLAIILTSLIFTQQSFAATKPAAEPVPVLVDASWLKELKMPYVYKHATADVALAMVTDAEREKLSKLAHAKGKCGGYQVLTEKVFVKKGNLREFSGAAIEQVFSGLDANLNKEKTYKAKKSKLRTAAVPMIQYDEKVAQAVNQVSETEVGNWIDWLAGFGGRFHASEDPNVHTRALVEKLNQMIANVPYASVHSVTHRSTRQNSVALRIEGSERPNEIVVLGGHLDSVNWSYFGSKNEAPGADDNASGSAANLEALRILLAQGRPQRTIEFFWYAAEEVGLNGSNEIATEYRNQKKDVVAVLQLDMTLFPGMGVGTIGNVSDFTTGWLRDLLVEMNTHYIKARLVDDKCGYACSDHASWYQKGYSTLMPFEATTNSMNNRIHTKDDRMNPAMSLKHAAMFSKIAVSYGMIVANSTLR